MVSNPAEMPAPLPSAVISAAQASDEVSSVPAPVVLDVRWAVGQPSQFSAYLSGHVPGAQWCDLDAELAAPPGAAGRHPLPDLRRLQTRLRDWGVTADSRVIVYDEATSVAAARAWWVLRWAGLRSVQVLNGGFQAWVQADLPVQTTVTEPARGNVVLTAGGMPSIDWQQAETLAGERRLLDVRTPERFRGEHEPMDPVAGRIPGALNLPAADLMNSDGTVAAPRAVLARLRRAGIDPDAAPDQQIGVYCGSGVTASHTVLALRQAGLAAALYPGSWSEWITDPDRPVHTG